MTPGSIFSKVKSQSVQYLTSNPLCRRGFLKSMHVASLVGYFGVAFGVHNYRAAFQKILEETRSV